MLLDPSRDLYREVRSKPIAAAMLDRLLHRSVVVNITGDSYRMRAHRARAEATRTAVAVQP